MGSPTIIAAIIIILSGLVVFKNLPLNQSQPTTDKSFQALMNTGSESSPSASVKASATASKKTPLPSSSAKATAKSSPNASSSSSSSGSGTSSSSSSSPTPSPSPSIAASPSPSPSVQSSSEFSGGGIKVAASCSGSSLTLTVTGDIASPNDSSKGIWVTLVDNSNSQSMIYEYTGNGGQPTTYIGAIIPPTQAIRGLSISPVGDGRSYSVKSYAAAYTTGTPSLDNQIAEVNFSKNCN